MLEQHIVIHLLLNVAYLLVLVNSQNNSLQVNEQLFEHLDLLFIESSEVIVGYFGVDLLKLLVSAVQHLCHLSLYFALLILPPGLLDMGFLLLLSTLKCCYGTLKLHDLSGHFLFLLVQVVDFP